jgi:acetate---CoA ligase (ADP-forming)
VANAAALEELDVNPLFVLPEGEGAIAVDALIRMRKT